MQKIEVGSVECPRLDGEEIPIGKCRACRFHLGVHEKTKTVICDFP